MANNRVKALVKPAILVIVSFLGILAITFFYMPYFNLVKVQNPILVTPNLGIDLYGLVLPLLIVLSCSVIYLRRPLSKITFVIVFFCCLLVAIKTSQVSDKGLMLNPVLFSFIASLIITFVSAAISLARKKTLELNKIFVSSLLLGLICIPLAIIFTDLYSLQFFSDAIIGGSGLADAILLSVLFAPLTITFVFSIFQLVFSAVSQIKLQNNKKSQDIV